MKSFTYFAALCSTVVLVSCLSSSGGSVPGTLPQETPLELGTWFARYRVTTEPGEVSVLREGGNPIGLTPLTVDLDSDRSFRLTFIKKGYTVTSRFIKPQPGVHHLHVVLEPQRP